MSLESTTAQILPQGHHGYLTEGAREFALVKSKARLAETRFLERGAARFAQNPVTR